MRKYCWLSESVGIIVNASLSYLISWCILLCWWFTLWKQLRYILCCNMNLFYSNLFKNYWNICVSVLCIHDLLIAVNIIVVAHVDAKEICWSRLCDIRSGQYKIERSSAWLTYPLPVCGNLVPAPTHTTSVETLACASRSLPDRKSVV